MVMPVEWDDSRIANLEDKRLISQLEDTVDFFQERLAELELASEDVGWIRLGGESNYEFSRSYLSSTIARSRLFFLGNPLINRAVSLQSDYVFAQGVSLNATSTAVNDVIQEFIDDPRNKQELTSHSARLLKEQTLMLDGNVFFVLFTDKANTGFVSIRTILVDEITDIITNPDDANEVWFYKREWMSRSENGSPEKQNVAYYPDIDYMPTKGRNLPRTKNGNTIYWDAPVIHVKTGSLAKSKFGTPETYSALSWANAHRKMLEDWSTIIATFARFAMKVTTKGGTNSVAATKQKLGTTVGSGMGETNPAPVAGSYFVRRDGGTDLEPIRTSGYTTSPQDARELRIMVAAAMGLPDPMLSGEVDVGNLATAKTLDRPTELKFRSRQKLWEDVTRHILDWIIRWSIEAPNGSLHSLVQVTYDARGRKEYMPSTDPDTGKPIDLHVEVVFPPILEKTTQERIDAVTNAVTLNGKSFAVDSPELKKLTIRLMLQALGLSDVDELTESIFAGISDDALANEEPPPEDQTQPPIEVRV